LLSNDAPQFAKLVKSPYYRLTQQLCGRNHALIFPCVFSPRDFQEVRMDFERVIVGIGTSQDGLRFALALFHSLSSPKSSGDRQLAKSRCGNFEERARRKTPFAKRTAAIAANKASMKMKLRGGGSRFPGAAC
jgi:hypothetical protein